MQFPFRRRFYGKGRGRGKGGAADSAKPKTKTTANKKKFSRFIITINPNIKEAITSTAAKKGYDSGCYYVSACSKKTGSNHTST